MSNRKYSKDDCIESVQKAAEILGESPTQLQYKELDVSPCYATISERYGWDNIKNLADISVCSPGSHISLEKPKVLDMKEKEWNNISTDRRQYLKNKCKVAELKMNSGCERCGCNPHPDALDFHHTDPSTKEFHISDFTKTGVKWERVEEEMSKCEIICANCHRKEGAKYSFSDKTPGAD